MERGADAVSVAQNVIVLSVDRLRAAYLGCYGNTWIATPALDRLATESFLCDEAHAAGPKLADFFRDAWGVHRDVNLLAQLTASGVRSLLLTDDHEVADMGGAMGFDEVVELPAGASIAAAEELEETHLASVFAAAIEQLDAARPAPRLLWLHVGSLGQTWDAPREFRERYHEEDDAPLPGFVAPPCKLLDANFDPDERWGSALAYAAQVSAFDACLDLFLEHLRGAKSWERTVLLLCGVRGYPLGEHRRVGSIDDALYGELLHVPWMMRLPDAAGALERCRELLSPLDLRATIGRLFARTSEGSSAAVLGIDLADLIHGESVTRHERLEFRSGDNQFALRTPDWYLRRTTLADTKNVNSARVELYAKPDDRWEVNDVCGRCVDIVDELLKES